MYTQFVLVSDIWKYWSLFEFTFVNFCKTTWLLIYFDSRLVAVLLFKTSASKPNNYNGVPCNKQATLWSIKQEIL